MQPAIDHQFTYLLGAGASAEALPVVANFPAKLESFKGRLSSSTPFHNPEPGSTQERLLNDLTGLINNVKFAASADTQAKRHYLQRQERKYSDLKMLLSLFFLVEEAVVRFDKRYELLFAQLLEQDPMGGVKLPGRIKILSWNYDLQVERAMNSFMGLGQGAALFSRLQSIPNVGQTEQIDIALNRFAILKLNGMAGAHTADGPAERYYFEISPQFDEDKLFSMIIKLYAAYLSAPEKVVPDIAFAWETRGIAPYIRKQALRVAEQTTVLICIGYSFPNFNRDYDRQLLGAMANLKTVYLQSHPDTIKEVKERFTALRPKIRDVRMNTDTKQFVLPYEY